jgi:hypothetical protein
MQKGDTAFSLDHTEMLHPTMFDAPSVAKPMQFTRLWPHLFISSLFKLNIFSPVAYMLHQVQPDVHYILYFFFGIV